MRRLTRGPALLALCLLAGCGGDGAKEDRAAVEQAVLVFYDAARAEQDGPLCGAITPAARRSLLRLSRLRADGPTKPDCRDLAVGVLGSFGRRATPGRTTVTNVVLDGDRARASVAAERGGLPLLRDGNGGYLVAPFAVPRVRARLKVDTACTRALRDITLYPLPPIKRAPYATWLRGFAREVRRDARELGALEVSGNPGADQRLIVRELRALARPLDRTARRVAGGADLEDAFLAGQKDFEKVEKTLEEADEALNADCGSFGSDVERSGDAELGAACRSLRRGLRALGTPASTPTALGTYFDGLGKSYGRLARTFSRGTFRGPAGRFQEPTVGTMKRVVRTSRAAAAAARRVDQADYSAQREALTPLFARLGSGLARLGYPRCIGS